MPFRHHIIRTLFLLFISFSTAISINASAPSANIEDVNLVFNIEKNGKKGFNVVTKFTVDGLKDIMSKLCVWVEYPEGTTHLVDDTYNKKNGSTHFVSYFTPRYESSRWDEYKYTIYNSELNLKPGEHTYYLFVTINDPNGKCLARSKYVTFNGTGSSSTLNNDYGHNHQAGNNNSNGQARTWREELGYGGFVIVNEYPTGFITRTRWRLCPNCNGTQVCGGCRGTRLCGICNGQGGIISAGYGNYYPCAICSTTGVCHSCGGSGQCACVKGDYPGYVIGSTSTIMPDGSSSRDSADYGSGSSSSQSSSSTSQRSSYCADCGGTRLWRGGKSPEYARPLSELVGYYNSSGSKCPHCDHWDEHWHSKCTTCKR